MYWLDSVRHPKRIPAGIIQKGIGIAIALIHRRTHMFNEIYSVDASEMKSKNIPKYFAVKIALSTELLLVSNKGEVRVMLCEMNDELRALTLELNALTKE